MNNTVDDGFFIGGEAVGGRTIVSTGGRDELIADHTEGEAVEEAVDRAEVAEVDRAENRGVVVLNEGVTV